MVILNIDLNTLFKDSEQYSSAFLLQELVGCRTGFFSRRSQPVEWDPFIYL